MKRFLEFITESTYFDQLKHEPLGTIVRLTIGSGFSMKAFDVMVTAHGFMQCNNMHQPGRDHAWEGLVNTSGFHPPTGEVTQAQVLIPGVKSGDSIKAYQQLCALPDNAVIRTPYFRYKKDGPEAWTFLEIHTTPPWGMEKHQENMDRGNVTKYFHFEHDVKLGVVWEK